MTYPLLCHHVGNLMPTHGSKNAWCQRIIYLATNPIYVALEARNHKTFPCLSIFSDGCESKCRIQSLAFSCILVSCETTGLAHETGHDDPFTLMFNIHTHIPSYHSIGSRKMCLLHWCDPEDRETLLLSWPFVPTPSCFSFVGSLGEPLLKHSYGMGANDTRVHWVFQELYATSMNSSGCMIVLHSEVVQGCKYTYPRSSCV